jgi:FtsZ-binding cell division protein ZapB
LKETIHKLKAHINLLEKENTFLTQELQNIISQKPGLKTKRKPEEQTRESFREDFVKRFKRDVLGEKE